MNENEGKQVEDAPEMKDSPAAFVGVTWHPDPASSGPRHRAFLTTAEVIVYVGGDWQIRPHTSGQTEVQGTARTTFAGSMIALATYIERYGSRAMRDMPASSPSHAKPKAGHDGDHTITEAGMVSFGWPSKEWTT